MYGIKKFFFFFASGHIQTYSLSSIFNHIPNIFFFLILSNIQYMNLTCFEAYIYTRRSTIQFKHQNKMASYGYLKAILVASLMIMLVISTSYAGSLSIRLSAYLQIYDSFALSNKIFFIRFLLDYDLDPVRFTHT